MSISPETDSVSSVNRDNDPTCSSYINRIDEVEDEFEKLKSERNKQRIEKLQLKSGQNDVKGIWKSFDNDSVKSSFDNDDFTDL